MSYRIPNRQTKCYSFHSKINWNVGFVNPFFSEVILLFCDNKGKALCNKKFFLYSLAENLLFGKLEPKVYKTDEKGRIFLKNIAEQKIVIQLSDGFRQFVGIRKEGITEIRIAKIESRKTLKNFSGHSSLASRGIF